MLSSFTSHLKYIYATQQIQLHDLTDEYSSSESVH